MRRFTGRFALFIAATVLGDAAIVASSHATTTRPQPIRFVVPYEKLRAIGAQPLPGSPADFARLIGEERARWIPPAKSLGVKAD